MKIRLAGIIDSSISNGEGLRKVIFVQGCKHNCKGCHNPETHNIFGGTECDTKDIIEEIKSDFMIDGITLSGGDPFEQAEACAEIAKNINNVWCYTGYTIEYILDHLDNPGWKDLLYNIDILVDGPFKLDLKSTECKYRGSTNQRIIDVKKYLKDGE